MNERVLEQYKKAPNKFLSRFILTFVVVGILVWSGSTIQFSEVSQNGLTIAKNIFFGIFNPDKELLFNLTTSGVP